MSRVRKWLPLLVMVAVLGVLIGVVVVSAGALLPNELRADSRANIRGCQQISVPNQGGEFIVRTPTFCKSGFCHVSFSWEGEPMGAYTPGVMDWVSYFQEPGGAWIGGPAIALGGVVFSDGIGVNGDGVYDNVLGGGVVSDGSWFSVLDDSGTENGAKYWTLKLVQNGAGPDRPLRNVVVYICPMLNK